MENRQAPLRTKCKVTQESQGPRGQIVYYIQCHWVLGMYAFSWSHQRSCAANRIPSGPGICYVVWPALNSTITPDSNSWLLGWQAGATVSRFQMSLRVELKPTHQALSTPLTINFINCLNHHFSEWTLLIFPNLYFPSIIWILSRTAFSK